MRITNLSKYTKGKFNLDGGLLCKYCPGGCRLSIYRVGLGSLDVRGGYFYGDDHTFFTVRLLYNHFITMNIKDLQRQRLPWILVSCFVLALKSTMKPLSCIQKRDKL